MAKKTLKRIGRAIYKAKTAPVQVASKIASKVAPGSGVDQVLSKAATPFKDGGFVAAGNANSRRARQAGIK